VSGRVLSTSVGSPRQIEWLGRMETTSIWKLDPTLVVQPLLDAVVEHLKDKE
jgi:hypothetical protein